MLIRRGVFFGGVVMIAFFLCSCSPTDPVNTEVALTAEDPDDMAQSLSTDSPSQPTPISSNSATSTVPPATPTITRTPQPTSKAPTYTPQLTPSVTNTLATDTQVAPCYQASFIQDVTYNDGASVAPGEIFLKVWRFRNEGSCPWSQSFFLDFVGGQRFSGPDEVNTKYFEGGAGLDLELGDRDWNDLQVYQVQPGDVVDIPVVLRAPLEEGRQRGYWRVLAEDRESVVMQFYVDVEMAFTLDQEEGIWSGEWEHENHWSDPSGNPLVFRQQERQVQGYYYNSNGEVFFVEASLSSDKMRMEGSFGQAWQSGWPFALEMYPNQNVFHGYYSDSDFTGGAWCGNRSGYAVPLGECLLVD